jgi:hypothetical protein
MSSPKLPNVIVRAAEQEAARHNCVVSFRQGGKHPFIMVVERFHEARSVAVSQKLIRSEFSSEWIKRDIRRLERQLAK